MREERLILTRVELDDHVFLQGQIDVIALRQGGDGGGEVFKVGGEPLGHHAAGAFLGSLEDGDILLRDELKAFRKAVLSLVQKKSGPNSIYSLAAVGALS